MKSLVKTLALCQCLIFLASCTPASPEKPTVPGGMVLVPGGQTELGDDVLYPRHKARVETFSMGITEVTWKELVPLFNQSLAKGDLVLVDPNLPLNSGLQKSIMRRTPGYSHAGLWFHPDKYPGWAYIVMDLTALGDSLTWKKGELEIRPGQADYPVVSLSWLGAVYFCNLKSEAGGLAPCYDRDWNVDLKKTGYRLPSFDEWEYAAKGGPRSAGYLFSGSNEALDSGWFAENSGGRIHPVKQKSPNELGLYDMSGNAGEFCTEIIGPLIVKDLRVSLVTSYRVFRGGSFSEPAQGVLSFTQIINRPDYAALDGYLSPFPNVGFRVVKSAP